MLLHKLHSPAVINMTVDDIELHVNDTIGKACKAQSLKNVYSLKSIVEWSTHSHVDALIARLSIDVFKFIVGVVMCIIHIVAMSNTSCCYVKYILSPCQIHLVAMSNTSSRYVKYILLLCQIHLVAMSNTYCCYVSYILLLCHRVSMYHSSYHHLIMSVCISHRVSLYYPSYTVCMYQSPCLYVSSSYNVCMY
jgi:hypothetical protein